MIVLGGMCDVLAPPRVDTHGEENKRENTVSIVMTGERGSVAIPRELVDNFYYLCINIMDSA